MLSNTILIVLLLTLMIQSLHAVGTVEVELGGPNDPCAKYTEEGHKYLALTHFRIIEAPDEMKDRPLHFEIVTNIICNFKSYDGKYKYKFECDGKRSGRTDTKDFHMFGVKVIKPMLSRPIEYMYMEDTMQLFENGFLDPANMKNEKFHHNRHLHIKRIITKGVVDDTSSRYSTNCHENFPHGLIADHGLYLFQARNGKNGIQPMYYDPYEQEGVLDITQTNN